MLRGSRRDEANVGSSLCVLPKLPPWNWPGPWPRWARWLRDEGNDQVHVEHSVHLFIKEFATSIVAPKWFDAAVLTRFQIISVFLAGAVYIIYIYIMYMMFVSAISFECPCDLPIFSAKWPATRGPTADRHCQKNHHVHWSNSRVPQTSYFWTNHWDCW